MPTIDQIYRDNLTLLSTAEGGPAALAKRLDKSASQVSQWINASKDSKTGKPRRLSADMARYIEQRCGKPVGWMDQAHKESEVVSDASGLRVAEPPPAPYTSLPVEYRQLLADLNDLPLRRRSALLDQIHQAAEEAREAADHLGARATTLGKVAAARRPPTSRSTTTTTKTTWGDGNRKQGSLALLVPERDPFTAAPSDREAKFYERVEATPKASEEEK